MNHHLQNLTQKIARAAPLLGSAFAGPGGAAIGTILAAKFGGDAQDPKALHALINNDPDAASKLKQIEGDHEVALQRLHLQAVTQEQQAVLADRSSARQREVVISKGSKADRDYSLLFLAYAVTGGFFLALAGLYFCTIPEGNQQIVLGAVSSMATIWIGVMAYYYGSSMGSRLKDEGLMQHLHNYAQAVHNNTPSPSVLTVRRSL
jgi:hypothetical protein